MNKAIIFDIDGTAKSIGDDVMPSERLKKAVARLQSTYHISTGTGRSLSNITDIIEFLGLTDPCIIAAGTEIYDPITKKIVWREPIPVELYEHIEHALKDNHDRVYTSHIHDEGNTGANVSAVLDGTTGVVYMIAMDPIEADRVVALLEHPQLHIINMHAFENQVLRDLHIHSSKASKEHAVNALLQMLEVKKEDSTVIGDGLNDLHLFVAGGTKVAMGNSVPELKEAADIVIKSIDEDGLAEYLESLKV